MLSTIRAVRSAKGATHLRLLGCPVSVAEQVLLLVTLAGLKNPYLSPKEILNFNHGYLGWRGPDPVESPSGEELPSQVLSLSPRSGKTRVVTASMGRLPFSESW